MNRNVLIQERLQGLPSDADILLVNCPHFNVQFPNAGMAYLCEALKDAGYRPAVFDFNVLLLHKYRDTGLTEYWEESKSDYLWRREKGYEKMQSIFEADIQLVAEEIALLPAAILGFSVNMMNERCTDDLVTRIKALAPEKHIIYGGFSYYHLALANEISDLPEAMVIGEGEETFVEYMDRVRDGKALFGVPGLLINSPEGLARFVEPCFTRRVDEIAWPKWREFNMDDYTFLYPRVHVPVHPSRGCGWGRCTFCSAAPTNPGYRHRSAENIFAEIKYLRETFGAEGIFLTTLQVNGDYEELGKLCDLIIESGIKIRPYGQFTIHKKMTRKFCDKLHKAGFIFISYGLESGSNHVLKLMKKGYNARVASQVLRNCHEAGVITSVNLVIGYPGETEKHFQETLAFLEENREVIDQVEVTPTLNVQFGSEMWDNPERFGLRFEHGHNEWVVNDWVSLDGENTYKKRTDRQARLLDFVKNLGIGRGYAEQELDFSKGQPKEYNSDLFVALAGPQCEKIFGDEPERILVLRSSIHEHVLGFIDILKKYRPSLKIDMFAQKDAVGVYAPVVGADRVVIYDESPLFNRFAIDRDKLERLKARRYDTVVFFYGQMTRGSYEEVRALAQEICERQVIGVDLRGKLERFYPGDNLPVPLSEDAQVEAAQ